MGRFQTILYVESFEILKEARLFRLLGRVRIFEQPGCFEAFVHGGTGGKSIETELTLAVPLAGGALFLCLCEAGVEGSVRRSSAPRRRSDGKKNEKKSNKRSHGIPCFVHRRCKSGAVFNSLSARLKCRRDRQRPLKVTLRNHPRFGRRFRIARLRRPCRSEEGAGFSESSRASRACRRSRFPPGICRGLDRPCEVPKP